MPTSNKTPGRLAYEAYYRTVGGIDLTNRQPLKSPDAMAAGDLEAWDAAAEAGRRGQTEYDERQAKRNEAREQATAEKKK